MTLDRGLIERALREALATGGDFADLYAEATWSSNVSIEDDRVDRVQYGQSRGVGIRVVAGDVTGYAYADGWDEEALLRAARSARAVARHGPASGAARVDASRAGAISAGAHGAHVAHREHPLGAHLEADLPPVQPAPATRVELARRANGAARAAGGLVRQVQVRLSDAVQRIVVASSDGVYAEDERRVAQLAVAVTAARDGTLQIGRRVRGGGTTLDLFERHRPEDVASEAAEVAIRMLDARPAPAGPMPVIVANGWGGVLFHEAVGHGLEADHVEKRSSVYADKLGQPVAEPTVTLIDDATIPDHRGSFRFDDEGVPAQQTALVVDGVLVAFLTDRKGARLLGLPESGNGRRQSFQYLPIPRMTNLYIKPGPADPAAILADTPRGLYVASLGGGQVDTTSGQFVFSVTEGYSIENGRLGAPVRGATLAGDSFSVLRRIDAVGNDFALDPGLGTCGKLGQRVAVGVGQPTLRVSEMTVGGTAT